MTPLDRDVFRERVRQNRTARAASLQTGSDTRRPYDSGRGGSVLAGDRVFDTITGQEGVVVAVTTENLIVPTPHRQDG